MVITIKKLLMTGGTGFIGKNLKPILLQRYEVVSPGRGELDLKDHRAVEAYLERGGFDTVFHCANPTPAKNKLDRPEDLLESSLRMFINLSRCRGLYRRMIYLGSGAQYDKTMDITNVSEKDRYRSVPKDAYGLAKLYMDEIAGGSENIYDLCVFGIYGPWDHSSKFITHCIRCCLNHQPITIRQDCRFDYLQVSDLADMVTWMIEHTPTHHTYNAGSGRHVLLSEIAAEVRRQMDAVPPVQVLTPGLNKEYTADSTRIQSESGITPRISLEKGISMQINWEKEWRNNETESC